MQFSNVLIDGQAQAVAVHAHRHFPLRQSPHASGELGARIARGEDLRALGNEAIRAAAGMDAAGASFAPLLTNPGKVICLGLNYIDHAKEGGRARPDYPWFFLRAASSLMGHGQSALLPSVSTQYDFEAELALVIGKRGKHLKGEAALDVVLGYSCFNDLSVRDFQKKTPQWTIGKNFDASGAFGPSLVLAQDLPRGAKGLSIRCRVNGQTLQEANTSDMIFGVQETLEILSACMTLEPGDVIVMGTPSGVGFARTPPLWLRHADTVEVDIGSVGTLLNTVQQEVA
ncbi:fumarylacetoacetate hydrolase family protein [Xenophilus arseniciresistens]|uniref:Fumarylacetoacetate hydrolase family protein n=1 Tax=Xenophilus arseniciresistens TaxID=1283306 RepID=A0AAE3NDR0_9BURK|nr:fumarylacetoacetate hydrolase family protein [Xenophilus arseniciresistens]MDA7419184.1 fumarylacetoacetate hydrolase family protein [Xenophilus arseniciresistens]